MKKSTIILLIIGILGIIFFVVKLATNPNKTEDIYTTEHFEQQLQTDPSTWTSAETENFNNFMEWEWDGK